MKYFLNSKTQEKKKKVTIIGAGYVGSSIAYALTLRDIAQEIVLIDINRNLSKGEALDIRHGIPNIGSSTVYDGDYSDSVDSDLIIITAGRNRRSNESRLELAQDNVKIANQVIIQLSKFYTKGVILVVSNPVDVITYKITEWTGLAKGMVFGTGCILDSSRLINVISDYIGLNTELIDGMIVGEHGESQVPIWSKVTISGIPIDEYCKNVGLSFTKNEIDLMSQKVKQMGTEIIENKGKTHYGIATCVCYLAEAILNNRRVVSSVSSILSGEYGIKDIALSLPSIIGCNGVERVIKEQWYDEEYLCLRKSESKLRAIINNLT